eukprot:TRINITY_DN3709_c0_g1_i1.p1 TRINITY_DN3709_c0_g1~~TRINITY_DN3709_c0_g1_i1.p1  ORF type:complete len:518 (-),score=54.45 TRINITY_DN3709_c0_g1_i1:27-1580(-)
MSNRTLVRAFKLRGLSVSEEALLSLTSLFEDKPDVRSGVLSEVFAGVDRSTLTNGQITYSQLQPFLAKYVSTEGGASNNTASADYLYRVIDSFDCPKYNYNLPRKSFERQEERGSIFGSAKDKAQMFEERFLLIQQRLKRNPLFIGDDALTPIESLLGVTGERYVLGFLSQLTEGEFYLEDTKSHVKVDVSELRVRSSGMFTEGSLVIAKGQLTDEVFKVTELALPPYEKMSDIEKTFPGVDFFGERPPLRIMQRVEQQMKYFSGTNMYVLSDVWLDNAKVMAQLRVLLVALADLDVAPDVFVFMGNFTSRPYGHEHADSGRLKHFFKKLADLLSQFTKIARETKFIFIPGPNDPGPGVLPRPPLPSYLTAPLSEKLRNVKFPSNPCRLRIGPKKVLIYRDDIAQRMRRHCLVDPYTPEDKPMGLHDHLVETLASSSHLCPLVESSKPIYWNYDHALRLYPLPDAVIIGDQFQSYSTIYDECMFLNPGPFHLEYSFINYEPFQHASEMSCVPEVPNE